MRTLAGNKTKQKEVNFKITKIVYIIEFLFPTLNAKRKSKQWGEKVRGDRECVKNIWKIFIPLLMI